jgi:hypothetical protein
MTSASLVTCAGCGGELPPRGGRGRPRRFCADCLPSEAVVGKAEFARRWRELNPAKVADYNDRRRQEVVSVVRAICGRHFERLSTDRRQYCEPGCARRRRREQERARKAA